MQGRRLRRGEGEREREKAEQQKTKTKKLAADEKLEIEMGRHVEIDRVEEGAHKTEPQTPGGRPARELEKAAVLCRVYESVEMDGKGEDAETPWEARSINTGHANAAPRPLL